MPHEAARRLNVFSCNGRNYTRSYFYSDVDRDIYYPTFSRSQNKRILDRSMGYMDCLQPVYGSTYDNTDLFKMMLRRQKFKAGPEKKEEARMLSDLVKDGTLIPKHICLDIWDFTLKKYDPRPIIILYVDCTGMFDEGPEDMEAVRLQDIRSLYELWVRDRITGPWIWVIGRRKGKMVPRRWVRDIMEDRIWNGSYEVDPMYFKYMEYCRVW